MSTIHQIFQSSFHFHHSFPYVPNNEYKMKKFKPLLKTKRSLYSEHRFVSWFGTMAVHKCQNSVVHQTHVKQKRESREARGGYCITSPRGIWGWPACENRDRTRAIERWGIPPRCWRRARAYIDITHALVLEHTTLSISRSTVSLRDLFVLQNSTNIPRFAFLGVFYF
jgi:hypothetical protein